MNITTDQYQALSILEKWYRKYNHQIIEISGIIGTGIWDVIQKFIEYEEFDGREIMYLSHNQKQVLELASKQYHAYYINSIIYNYTRYVDIDSIHVINSRSNQLQYEWKKKVKKKIDPKYKLMVVFDSLLLNKDTIEDLASFGLPIILIRDPMLLPASDSYTFFREPNIVLKEPHPDYMDNPIIHFAYKILNQDSLKYGNYDTVSIIPKKQMNLYNIKSCDMVITLSDIIRNQINNLYRGRLVKSHGIYNIIGERLIITENMYNHKLVNPDEKRIKLYLTKGLVGTISKINRHVATTKYVPFEFQPEFYHESFNEIVLDRHYLNKMVAPCRQIIPDECVKAEYAYALTPQLARLSHWDKVTLILDKEFEEDEELLTRMIYTAITRSRRLLTIMI